jgi:glutaminyl-peptide cyclotransferase
MRLNILVFLLLFAAGCGGTNNSNTNSVTSSNRNALSNTNDAVPSYTYEIVKSYPHDSSAFTQGLIFHDGFLYEGTGGSKVRGDDFYSSLRKVDIASGKVLQKYDLPPEVFGEGIAVLNDKVYQLTWREHVGFIYNLADFKLVREVKYSGEGWGLTTDGTSLYMSDGTHVIRVVNPETFETTRTIVVNDERGKPIVKLNELEWIKGEIWANVWETGTIMRIDPNNGKLLGRIDLSKLMSQEMDASDDADVLNGIAYDEAGDRIFITGKKWKHLYEIKVQPKAT